VSDAFSVWEATSCMATPALFFFDEIRSGVDSCRDNWRTRR